MGGRFRVIVRSISRKISRGVLRALIAAVAAWTASAVEVPTAIAQGKGAAIVVDANTGQTLHAQAADEPRFPASLTKMMTLYLVFENIEQGRLSYGTKIKMSQEAASAAPSKLDLEPGEQISLGDAIKALITKSANDIAVAVGEHIAGSEARFAQLMTERARQLGMRGTTFRNASGLPNPGQVTTARDMITLGLRLHDDFPRHYALFTTRTFSFHGNSYRNHNNLLFNYPGTEGIKTGYTGASGFNVVVSVKREGKHVVAAVFGGGSASARDAQMRAILNRTLPKASKVRTRKSEPMLVARAPAAPAPKLAVRPAKPEQVALAAGPKPDPRPAVAVTRAAAPAQVVAKGPPVAPAPAAAAPPARQPAAGTPAAPDEPETPIAAPASQVAIAAVAPLPVRRVMVAPRPRQMPPSDTTEERGSEPTAATMTPLPVSAAQIALSDSAATSPTSLLAETSAIVRGDLRAPTVRRASGDVEPAPRHDAPLDETETSIPKTAVVAARPTEAREQIIATSAAQSAAAPAPGIVPPIRTVSQPPAPVRVSAPASAPIPATSAVRGAPPSTLDAQAANLPRGTPAAQQPARIAQAAQAGHRPAYRLNGPETSIGKPGASVPAEASNGFHIQVGAFATAAEAERQLASLGQRAGSILAAATPITLPVVKGNRQFYRARFAGLDASRAASVCLELRRLQVDCFVMRAE